MAIPGQGFQHPDRIFRRRKHWGDEETAMARRIIRAAMEQGIPLEINMYGFSDGRHYPCDRFFKMAKELKPKFVMGCDAHIPELIRQPESAPGLSAFLAKHGIEYGDNVIDIVNPNL